MAGEEKMVIIGLTGSIAMGKSTAAGMLREMGVPVHDSDAAVHELMAPGGAAVAAVAARFPQAYDAARGAIDRKILGRMVFDDPAARRELEAIIHPLVRQGQEKFLQAQRQAGAQIVCLDIPLLFETGADQRVDVIIVVSAPYDVQRARILARPGMDEARFAKIRAMQMSDEDKRARADYIVMSDKGFAPMKEKLAKILKEIAKKELKNDSGGFPSYDG